MNRKKRVRCITNGKTYDSIKEAAKALYMSTTSISKALTNRTTACGMRFKVVGYEYSGKKVQCIETEQIYESMAAAAKAIGVSQSSISASIRGDLAPKGFHFRLYQEGKS